MLADLVTTSEQVAATRSRTAKVALIADLLGRLEPSEVAPGVAFLAGGPRQGKVGVGWATLGADVAPATAPTLTVADVDHTVGRLAALAGSGAGSNAARARLVTDLLGRATEAEASFIRRLLLGELRQGALERVVVEAVARAAAVPPAAVARAVMLAGDLPSAAEVALTAGEPGLAAVTLQVLRPVQSMLASTADSVEAAMAVGEPPVESPIEWSVEWKLDGARVQAHRAGDEVRLFTRNLHDVTDRLPGVTEVLRSLAVDRVVLDGEVVGGDVDRGPDAFQDTMSRFGRRDGTGGATLVVRFFDCLHLDGVDLIDLPLRRRLDVLERVAGAYRVPGVVTADPAEALAFSEGALAAGHEGVMVKAVDSRYEAGRRGQAWRKVKPVRTFDLVVLAAEWGHGRRRGWLSNLHLGARTPEGFAMVGKTFKGLTDELLTWQTARLLELETGRRGITVEVRPELVVEVALDGVQASTRYAGGVALRFARVRRYRPDKSPDEADVLDALQSLLPGRPGAPRPDGEGPEGPDREGPGGPEGPDGFLRS